MSEDSDSPRPVGRPSLYDPKYCAMLIEDMKAGFSFEAFAALIDVSKETLYEWTRVHPEFSDAKKKAFEMSRRFWEKIGIDHIITTTETEYEQGAGRSSSSSKMLNSSVYIFNMKNRFPKEWRDRKELTGANGKDLVPVQVVVNIPNNNRPNVIDEDEIEGSED